MSTDNDSGGAVYPRQDCPHLFAGCIGVDNNMRINFEEPCECCNDATVERWCCLGCGKIYCSRYAQGHMEEHWLDTMCSGCQHCVVLSMQDLSIWCYACNSYIKHEILMPIQVHAEASKFSTLPKFHLLNNCNASFQCGFVYPNLDSLLHQKILPCYERPQRTMAVYDRLKECALLSKMRSIETCEATPEQLLRVHSPAVVDMVTALSEHGVVGEAARQAVNNRADMFATAATGRAALQAAGSVVALTKMVCRGDIMSGLALVRPPGHHASRDKCQGFCFFNNIAVAARAAQHECGVSRVLILDFDIHHGDGTQDIFYEDKDILTVSIHRRMFLGGGDGACADSSAADSDRHSGEATAVGRGPGIGFNVNIPLGDGLTPGTSGRACDEDVDYDEEEAQAGDNFSAAAAGGGGRGVSPVIGDADYLMVMRQVVMPICRQFCPELVLIAAGFDAQEGDRLLSIGGYGVTPAGFASIVREVMTLVTDRHADTVRGTDTDTGEEATQPTAGQCRGVVLSMEGGYDLVGLADSVAAVARELTADTAALSSSSSSSSSSSCSSSNLEHVEESSSAETSDVCHNVRSVLAPHWKCFQPLS